MDIQKFSFITNFDSTSHGIPNLTYCIKEYYDLTKYRFATQL